MNGDVIDSDISSNDRNSNHDSSFCKEDDLSGREDDVNNKEYDILKKDNENDAGDDISKEWPQHEFAKRYMSFILINDVF